MAAGHHRLLSSAGREPRTGASFDDVFDADRFRPLKEKEGRVRGDPYVRRIAA